MLRDLQLKGVYKSDLDNILESFYVPALFGCKPLRPCRRVLLRIDHQLCRAGVLGVREE